MVMVVIIIIIIIIDVEATEDITKKFFSCSF